MNALNPSRRAVLSALGAAAVSCGGGLRANVGSKEGAEGILVGEIAALLLEKKGKAKVERRLALGNSSAVYQALQSGDLHVYPEYSRIGYRVLFQTEEPMDRIMSTEKLRGLFRSNAQAEWLDPLGFESNHIVIARAGDPRLADVSNLTAAAAIPEARLRLGFTSEFSQSPEGYTQFKSVYRMPEPGAPRIEPIGQLYFGLNDNRIDLMVTTSMDPLAYDPKYKILADDQGAFAGNRCSLLLHGPTVEKSPELAQILRTLSGKLPNDVMLRLTGEVIKNKRAIAEVAAEWFTSSGLA
jgi:osmoprotectant transport system permease protein